MHLGTCFFLLLFCCCLCEVFDFTRFEDFFLKVYLEEFSLSNEINYRGNYSFLGRYDPLRKLSLYGSADVLFTLFIVNQLNLSEEEKNQWSEVINSFQEKSTGQFKTELFEEICGFQPWHASAYAVSALRLIDRFPKHEVKFVYDVAQNRSVWNDVFDILLEPNPPMTIWQTSHKIAAFHSILLALKKEEEFEEFFEWWYEWLEKNLDDLTGYWCKKDEHCRPPYIEGMGGSFHMFMLYRFMNRPWKMSDVVFEKTLSLQKEDGLFDPQKHFSYCIDLDGVLTIVQSSINLEKKNWDKVEDMCRKYLRSAEKIFNEDQQFLVYLSYTHLLPGALDAIAHCQEYFPEMVKTKNKWRQSLDYVPYI